MIQDGISGYLVDSDSEAIDRIRELTGSREKRETMGTQARSHASSRSWRNATDQLIDFYREALEMHALTQTQEADVGPMGLGAKARKALGRATVFALRRLLP